jgi:hypothetical protein
MVLLAGSVSGDDKKGESARPFGIWKRTAGDNTVTFDIKANTMRCTIVAGGNTIECDADYSVTKSGVIFGRLSKVTKKGGDEGPSEGDLFSFRFTLEKDTMTLSDLKTSSETGEAKQLVEGEYKKE